VTCDRCNDQLSACDTFGDFFKDYLLALFVLMTTDNDEGPLPISHQALP
jgi:hypothetical protein